MFKDFTVTPKYFRGNRKYGRTTMVTEKSTGASMEFMGALSKGFAINQFKKRRM